MNKKKCFKVFPLLISLFLMINMPSANALDFWDKLTKNESVTVSPFASLVKDPECQHPIDDFDVAGQAITIAKIGGSIAWAGGDYRKGLQAAKTMNWMPVSLEVMLGKKLHDIRNSSHTLINPKTKNKRYRKLYVKVNNVLKDLLEDLPNSLPFDTKIFITTDHGVNASAQPGGYLYITKKAAEKDKSFLAVMLAHEIFHITQRHTTLMYQAAIIDSIDSYQRFKSLLSGNMDIQSVTGLAMLTSKVVMSFDVAQEAQADTCAAYLITKLDKKYHVGRGVKVFLRESSKGRDSANPMFSSHPSYEQRSEIFQIAMGNGTPSSWAKKPKGGYKTKVNQGKGSKQVANTRQKPVSIDGKLRTFDESKTKYLDTLSSASLALQGVLDKVH